MRWPVFPASKVVPQENGFPVLVSPRGNKDFLFVRRLFYVSESKTMATLTRSHPSSYHI
jgi:hypothetical protein